MSPVKGRSVANLRLTQTEPDERPVGTEQSESPSEENLVMVTQYVQIAKEQEDEMTCSPNETGQNGSLVAAAGLSPIIGSAPKAGLFFYTSAMHISVFSKKCDFLSVA